jgi:putative transposase
MDIAFKTASICGEREAAMELHAHHYYHTFNRSNNNEIVFKSPENYPYFLDKYIAYCSHDLDTVAYCLMPTHFHFLTYVKTSDTDRLRKNLGLLLSSYTKAINRRFGRHGSLFQEHTKSKCIDTDAYLLSLLTYIHQNPVRARLAKRLEDWKYSSYRDYLGLLDGVHSKNEHPLQVKKDIVFSYFSGVAEFERHSSEIIETIEKQ